MTGPETPSMPTGAERPIVDVEALRGRPPAQGAALQKPALDSILRIPVVLQVVLGAATMPVASLMKLGRGAVVPLDHRVGEPVDVVVNGRVIARGEVVVVDDDNSRFGVSLTEIVGASAFDPGA